MKENMWNRIPLKVYRRLRWEKEQRPIYRKNLKKNGKEYAKVYYHVDRALYLHRPAEEVLRLAEQRDRFLLDYVQTMCADVIERYRSGEVQSPCEAGQSRNIWVFWWTGEESAPELVKACLKSIRRNANGHPVIFLDRTNWQQYVQLPQKIVEKHESGKMCTAHFSDIVRNTLLAQYGGVWIDATVFLSQTLPEELFTMDFFTAKTVDPKASYYSKSRWVGFFLAGRPGFPLFSFTRDMLLSYWEKEDEIVDYLLMDYIFGIAREIIPEVRQALDTLPDNNLLRGQLMSELNHPYSQTLFNQLQNGETFISKLSWRYGSPKPRTADGQLTNYGHLLEL